MDDRYHTTLATMMISQLAEIKAMNEASLKCHAEILSNVTRRPMEQCFAELEASMHKVAATYREDLMKQFLLLLQKKDAPET